MFAQFFFSFQLSLFLFFFPRISTCTCRGLSKDVFVKCELNLVYLGCSEVAFVEGEMKTRLLRVK